MGRISLRISYLHLVSRSSSNRIYLSVFDIITFITFFYKNIYSPILDN